MAAHDSTIEKRCTKCGVLKSLSEFHKHSLGLYGVNPVCKDAALRQALYAFARYLEGELLAMQFRPNYAPFVGFAILPDGRTLAEHIAERTGLLLSAG